MATEAAEKGSKYWDTLLLGLKTVKRADLKRPCVQVALYDKIVMECGYSFGVFEEIKEFKLPFCKPIWCGVDAAHKHLLGISFCTRPRFEIRVIFLLHNFDRSVDSTVAFVDARASEGVEIMEVAKSHSVAIS